MQSVSSRSRGLGHIFALCAILAVAGCQSSDTAGVLNPGGDQAAQSKITQDELRALSENYKKIAGFSVSDVARPQS